MDDDGIMIIFFLICIVLYLAALAAWYWVLFLTGAAVVAIIAALFTISCACLYFNVLGQVMVVKYSPIPAPIRYPPRVASPDGDEPAYRQYLFGQAMRDLRHVLSNASERCENVGRSVALRINELCFNPEYDGLVKPFTWPAGILAWAGLSIGIIGAGLVVCTVVAIHIAVVGVLQGIAWTLIAVLRLVDTVLLRTKRIRISCPNPGCFKRVAYPSYNCPNAACRLRQGDVRPGRYGILHRICACETQMPTLILLGSHTLEAFCPACTEPLVSGAGTAPEIILPVFGATAAGKTRLMGAMTMALNQIADHRGAVVSAADSETERAYTQLKSVLVRGEDTPPTRIILSRAYSFYVAPATGPKWLFRVFDAAGERFDTSERLQELQYLAIARSFIFVIDLLSVNTFWDSLNKSERDRLAGFRSVFRQPDFVFQQALENIQAMGGTMKHARLAVVISKADIVAAVSVLNGTTTDHDSLKSLLADRLGLANMIRLMEHNFAAIGFFFTSAIVDRSGAVDLSIESLTNWLLSGEGFQLEPAVPPQATMSG